MKSAVLCLLVTFIGVVFGLHPIEWETESVLLVPGASEKLMYDLVHEGFDVRGMFGEHVYMFTTTFKSLNLVTRFPGAMNLEFPHKNTMIVVEGDSTTVDWAKMIKTIELHSFLEILYQSTNLIFLGVHNHPGNVNFDFSLEIPLPRDAEFVALPRHTIVPVTLPETHPAALKKATYKASVGELVAAINEDDLLDFALYLSGEGGGSDFTTRHSYSSDAERSGEWAISVFEGYGFNATKDPFPGTYCPNIIAEKRGTRTPNQYVIVGAHLDCRNRDLSDSTGRAPGANDDGSGSAAILQIAKAIFDTQATFQNTLILALWCGEEQGLVGSRAYARDAANNNVNIVGMFQADMIGYQAYAQPQCAFVNRYTNTDLTNYAKDIADLYVPEITQVDTSACCSDHQSFYEQGYPSVGLVEGGGYTIDPQYHTVGDSVNRNGYSLNQMRGITRVLAASAADLAGIN